MPYKNKQDRLEQTRRWREENRDRSREIQKQYRIRNQSKINKSNRLRKKKNYIQESARWKFLFAIKRGWIIRPEGKQFHHPDYSRPYFGAWLTALEHRQVHAGWIECPPCHDYSEQVDGFREKAIAARNSNGGIAANKLRWGK